MKNAAPDNILSQLSDLGVSHETVGRLELYHEILVKWQSTINLISNQTLHHIWSRHILDSIQLLPHLENNSGAILDIGSGAGFPGMALAISGVKNIHLIESDTKKITFLKEVARITNTEVAIHNTRIEMFHVNQKAGVILSRAVTSLDEILSLCESFVSHETKCLFHKGKNWSKEMEEAKKNFQFDEEIIPSLTEPEAVIVKLSHIVRRNHDPKLSLGHQP